MPKNANCGVHLPIFGAEHAKNCQKNSLLETEMKVSVSDLNSVFWQLGSGRERLALHHVGVVGLLKGLLQLVDLTACENSPSKQSTDELQ